MKVVLKNVKYFEQMSHETLCFQASLYLDGKRIAIVENSGQGESNKYSVFDRDLFKVAEDFAKSSDKYGDSEHLDSLVFELFEDFQKNKQMKSWCKNKTVFRLKGDKKDEWRIIKIKFTSVIEEKMKERYPDLEEIANLSIA